MPDPQFEPTVTRQAVTEDMIRRLDEALDATKGNRAHAAQLVGVDVAKVNSMINYHDSLRFKWSKADAKPVEPGAVANTHREAPVKPFATTDEQLAEAQRAEDELWQQGCEKLNFTPAKQDFLGAVMKAHGNHWKATTQMFQGGVSYTATELLFMFHKIEEQIQRTLSHPEEFVRHAYSASGDKYVVKSDHEFRMEMMDRALSIADMFRKLNQDSERAQLLAAQIEKLKVGEAKQVKKRKQAGWKSMNPQQTVPGETTS